MADEFSTKRTRASGEVLDYLLREFETNQNPSPEQRKDISERTNMSEKAVRIWFQNRRAKVRKFERMGKPVKQASNHHTGSNVSSRSNLLTQISAAGLRMHGMIPVELNENYCFVECSSLSVGSWQRIKSGHFNGTNLLRSLVNLSPFTLNNIMENVDLMVILSRKNHEINYFFSAISNNSKILFRIFYPISSVLHSSILDNSISKDNNEMRLNLSRKPKFSVYFFNGVNANLNQWSICDDFSEGQQVSSAFYGTGGSSTPHVLVGTKVSLEFLNTYILENLLQQKEYSGIPGSMTPLPNPTSSHSESMANKPPVHNQNQHDEAFDLKHDIPSWGEVQSSEKSFSLKGLSLIANFDGASPASPRSDMSQHATKPPYIDEKPVEISPMGANTHERKDYEDMFSAPTPDFFSAVQTPSTNFMPHAPKNEDAHFMHSPSMGVESYDAEHHLDKRHNSEGDGHIVAGDYNQDNHNVGATFDDENIYHSHQVDQQYNFEIPESHEFQANELIVHSPTLSNGTPNTVGSNAHVDNFIDFNAH